jgi:glycosyltransferase involved in cell wall biosynthesis
MEQPIIDVIIPAYNEEQSIGHVLRDIPSGLVRDIIVCDNNSTDQTASVAQSAGATVVRQIRKGYGMAHIAEKAEAPDIIVFLDGDYSDYPDQMPLILEPILHQGKSMVIGSRALGKSESGSMTIPQIFGNWLATSLIRVIYGYRFTDLGPFRAITYPALLSLNMEDPDFGWTVEMQVKAAKKGLACAEVPVDYKRRIGVSKVSGTIKGTIMAGYKILWTIFKLL